FITNGTIRRQDEGTSIPLHQNVIHTIDISCFSPGNVKTGSPRKVEAQHLVNYETREMLVRGFQNVCARRSAERDRDSIAGDLYRDLVLRPGERQAHILVARQKGTPWERLQHIDKLFIGKVPVTVFA